jgi:hypothetical protein
MPYLAVLGPVAGAENWGDQPDVDQLVVDTDCSVQSGTAATHFDSPFRRRWFRMLVADFGRADPVWAGLQE